MEAVAEFNILVGGGREALVETPDGQKVIAPDRDVGGVEAAEGRIGRIGDLREVEAVAGREELHERGYRDVRVPVDVADRRHARPGRGEMALEELRVRDAIVVGQDDQGRSRGPDAEIARGG